ncbi:MAG: type II secretion system protein N [Desulfovibrionales bacterium]
MFSSFQRISPRIPLPNPKIFRSLCIALAVIFCAHFTAKGVALFLSQADAETETIPVSERPDPPSRSQESFQMRPASEYQSIASSGIFGKTEPKPPKKAEDDIKSMPQAVESLNLNLVGTVVADDPAQSIAIIRDSQKKEQEIYRIGDNVKNITIKRILRNSIIIDNGSRNEVLSMDIRENGTTLKYHAEPRKNELRQTKTISQDNVDQSLGDLATLMNDARINAYFENGKPAGFQVSGIKPESFYTEIGLKDRDVVLRVNGQNFTDPSQILSLRNDLDAEDFVTLTVKRNGRNQDIRYNLVQ